MIGDVVGFVLSIAVAIYMAWSGHSWNALLWGFGGGLWAMKCVFRFNDWLDARRGEN